MTKALTHQTEIFPSSLRTSQTTDACPPKTNKQTNKKVRKGKLYSPGHFQQALATYITHVACSLLVHGVVVVAVRAGVVAAVVDVGAVGVTSTKGRPELIDNFHGCH